MPESFYLLSFNNLLNKMTKIKNEKKEQLQIIGMNVKDFERNGTEQKIRKPQNIRGNKQKESTLYELTDRGRMDNDWVTL